jgi:MerR family transcriptional regulator, copper efflux regulator
MRHDIKIGELAECCGVSRDTIRFYERAGLLRQPSRTASRHRIYDEQAVAQLRLIRGLQGLGLTLEDIRHLLRLRPARGLEAGKQLIRLLRARADAIDSKISRLQALRLRLDEAIGLCEGSPARSFSVLERLVPDGIPAGSLDAKAQKQNGF